MTPHLTGRRKQWLNRGLGLVTLVVLLMGCLMPTTSRAAANLTMAHIILSRQQESQASGVTYTAFWKPASTATEAKFQIIFPNGDDGLWCRNNGALTLATTTIDSASDPSASNATCTKGTNGSTYDTIDFDTANLTAGTLYGIVISGDVGVLGTAAAGLHITTLKTRTSAPADIDSLNVGVATIADDQVDVTADIGMTLTVTLSPTTSVDLGTITASQVAQASMTSTVVSNATNGYVSTVLYNQTLTSGSYSIPAETGGGTITEGTSEFGASTNDASSVDLATTSGACTAGAGPKPATALSTTTPKIFASGDGATLGTTTTLCFVAGIAATQQPGTYSSTMTLVTTGKF